MRERHRFKSIDMRGEWGQLQAVVAVIGPDIVKHLLCRPYHEFLDPVGRVSFIVVPVAKKCPRHILGNFHCVGTNTDIRAASCELPDPAYHLLGRRLNHPGGD